MLFLLNLLWYVRQRSPERLKGTLSNKGSYMLTLAFSRQAWVRDMARVDGDLSRVTHHSTAPSSSTHACLAMSFPSCGTTMSAYKHGALEAASQPSFSSLKSDPDFISPRGREALYRRL